MFSVRLSLGFVAFIFAFISIYFSCKDRIPSSSK